LKNVMEAKDKLISQMREVSLAICDKSLEDHLELEKSTKFFDTFNGGEGGAHWMDTFSGDPADSDEVLEHARGTLLANMDPASLRSMIDKVEASFRIVIGLYETFNVQFVDAEKTTRENAIISGNVTYYEGIAWNELAKIKAGSGVQKAQAKTKLNNLKRKMEEPQNASWSSHMPALVKEMVKEETSLKKIRRS